MEYRSLSGQSPQTDFRTAVLRGLAPDKSLYFPTEIPKISADFWKALPGLSPVEIGLELMAPLVAGSLENSALQQILNDTLSFDFPLVAVGEHCYSLELFHGPTMAFKDVGARFMAGCLEEFNRGAQKKTTVLVATSGDTGGAVARGFLGVEGVEVVILYPRDKVSDIQERQLTTLGKNIKALRVEGDFDACQHMVKEVFLDPELSALTLTSANSINVARWMPQLLYYVLAYRSYLKMYNKSQANSRNELPEPVFSVPSGNFGNICAGILAHKMGLPAAHFVAATNSNDTVPRYLATGKYVPHKTQPTISNAMDVSDPSNWVRINELFHGDLEAVREKISAFRFTDAQTRQAMQEVAKASGYICDPHGAVGFLGLQAALKAKEITLTASTPGIFLETAHPIKFRPEVEKTLGINLEIPPQISAVMKGKKEFDSIDTYGQLREFLLTSS
ncbi:threonine synthase [Robiginitalea myxolifaciens]|uniref:threonine synthase n=1 Tax=Robiginitalea myxolifaciens TaxID=400055 RepID=UPI000B8357DD|nr:threonine synthase [Robiginitalea myxolifaciens]